jgi:arylsulfatase/arylsulfatase A
MPLLRGEQTEWPDRALFFQWHGGPVPFEYIHFAVRTQRYKLVQGQDDPHSFVHHPTGGELQAILEELELYDVQADPSEIDDIAAAHPEIVESLLARYEDWFSDVTRMRDYHAPQAIHLGADEAPVVLSRFEWIGPRVDTNTGTWDEQQGHWRCRVVDGGDYEVTLHFSPFPNPGTATVRFGGRREVCRVERGQTSCRLSMRLAEGVGRFEAFLRTDRLRTGVHFAEIAKRD